MFCGVVDGIMNGECMQEEVLINLHIVWHFGPVVKTRNPIVIAAVRGWTCEPQASCMVR